MNREEAAMLLAHCASFDNRKPSAAAAAAWASALHDVPLDQDARDAVAAYYTTAPKDPDQRLWILPHHIRTLRTKLRNKRLENFQYEPIHGETTAQYLTRYRGQVQAIASGRAAPHTGQPALEGAPSHEFMRELEARGWTGNRTVPDQDEDSSASLIDTVRRSGPLGVRCPTCSAAVGRSCKTPGGNDKQPLGKPRRPHSSRLRLAQGEPVAEPGQAAAEEQRRRAASRLALATLPDDATFQPDDGYDPATGTLRPTRSA